MTEVLQWVPICAAGLYLGYRVCETALAVTRYSRASFNPRLTIQAERFIWRIMRRFADTHPGQTTVLVAEDILLVAK